MRLELPHETDTTHEAISKWLRDLAEAVDNSNSHGEYVATMAYRLIRDPNQATRDCLFDEVQDAMDNCMDIDIGLNDLARAVVDRLLPKKEGA